jgi:hypothetical protein
VRANELIGGQCHFSDSFPSSVVHKWGALGISQRDTNYYEFWNDPETQRKVSSTVRDFWETNIKPKWMSCHQDCVLIFMLIITNDLI